MLASYAQLALARVRRFSGVWFASLLLFGLVAHNAIMPVFTETQYMVNKQELVATEMPLLTETPEAVVNLWTQFDVHWYTARKYLLHADNCLRLLIINVKQYPDLKDPCDYQRGFEVDLTEYVQTGRNALTARIYNEIGGVTFILEPSLSDWRTVVTDLALIVGLLGTAYTVLRRFAKVFAVETVAVLLGGFALRLVYMFATTIWTRGHDVGGHLEYARYIHEHWALPAAFSGWESWQPPLYYITLGSWWSLMEWCGFSEHAILFHFQIFAWITSCLTLVAGAYWLHLTVNGTAAYLRQLRVAILCAFATVPSVVFMAARLNNDVLVLPLLMGVLIFAMQWWKHRKITSLVWLSLALVLAVLAKGSALVLVPAVFVLLLCSATGSLRRRFAIVLVPCLCAVLAFGAVGVLRGTIQLRAGTSLDRNVVGNIDSLNTELRISPHWSHLLVFNPWQIYRHPFADAWGGERREYFFEYNFITYLFGEYDYERTAENMARWLAVSWMLLLGLAMVGVVQALRKWEHVPQLIFSSILIAGHICFVWVSPFATSQDFRYVSALVLPASTLLFLGAYIIPKWAQKAVLGLCYFTSALGLAFILSL